MATKKQKEAAKKILRKPKQNGGQCHQGSMHELNLREEEEQNPEQKEKETITVLSYVPRKNSLPLGTMMLDGLDTYKGLLAKDQVDRGMMKHGSSAKWTPILRIENWWPIPLLRERSWMSSAL